MDADFWLARWREGRIGWHQDEVDRLLQKHWPGLDARAGETVFVPLCGKSLDMAWLAGNGYPVLGVDLSLAACEAFFDELGAATDRREEAGIPCLQAQGVTLYAGDLFALPAELVGGASLVYDRAALIALPADMRPAYVDAVYGTLPAGARGLLITLEHPPGERGGPPFAVPEAEVRALLEPEWQVVLAERRDILEHEPRFAAEGVSALHTCVYRLHKAGPAPSRTPS